jgi:hypothetical protein
VLLLLAATALFGPILWRLLHRRRGIPPAADIVSPEQ